MSLKVKRNYLEIYSIDDLIDVKIIPKEFKIELTDPPNFQLNKFFYKGIGKNHRWTDRFHGMIISGSIIQQIRILELKF